MAEQVTVRVLEVYRAGGYRLRPGSIVQLPDHVVAQLPEGIVEVLGPVKEVNVDTLGKVTNLPAGTIGMVKLPEPEEERTDG